MIYKYTPHTDEYTTHTIRFPHDDDGNALGQVLARIGDDEYAFVPDDVTMPEQVVTLTQATAEEVELVKKHSPHYALINRRVVEKVREKYSVDDEFKMNRIATGAIMGKYSPTPEELAEIDDFEKTVLAARDWGRQEKAKIGL